MTYNIDFLIAAMVILLLVLWYFLGQKRAEDLNNQVFLFFAVLGTADVVAEFFTNYYITSYNSDMEKRYRKAGIVRWQNMNIMK